MESELLGYSENILTSSRRTQLERHFANCEDCVEVLAFIAREPQEPSAAASEEVATQQANRILGYIRNADLEQKRVPRKAQTSSGFYISYAKLAIVGLVFVVTATTAVFVINLNQPASGNAMDALRLAVKDARNSEARISGGFAYSRHLESTRGVEAGRDSLHFDRAENKAKAAAAEEPEVDAKFVLARSYLARGTAISANQALAVLDQLSRSGVETAETLNDSGVAQFQLGDYDNALTFFGRSLEKSPGYEEALFNLALAHERLRQDKEAREAWQRFINRSSDENWRKEAATRLKRLSETTER